MQNLTSGVAYGASASSILTGLLSSFTYDEWNAIGVIVGISIALLTALVNFYFRWKDEKRKEREHESRFKK